MGRRNGICSTKWGKVRGRVRGHHTRERRFRGCDRRHSIGRLRRAITYSRRTADRRVAVRSSGLPTTGQGAPALRGERAHAFVGAASPVGLRAPLRKQGSDMP
jgi:hypothetical protein